MVLLIKSLKSIGCALSLAGATLLLAAQVSAGNRGLKPAPAWLAFGDIRGNISPCGCDPLTDLGGMRRLAYFLELERLYRPHVLILNLGNNYAREKQGAHKNVFLNSVLAKLNIDVALLNRLELAALAKGQKVAEIKYVLSNATDPSPHKAIFSKFFRKDGYTVFGYTSPDEGTFEILQPLSKKMLQDWRKIVNSKGHRGKKILLFSGSDKELEAIAAEQIFDSIISSNQKPFSASFDHIEKESPGKLLTSFSNQPVYQVPLGGLGVLRGGEAAKKTAPTLGGLLPQGECRDASLLIGSKACTALPQVITWMTRDYISEGILVREFERLAAANNRQFSELAKQRAKSLASSEFVGAAACQGCHAEAYKIWSASSHAKAFATLEVKKESQNTDCVGCHVVGYAAEGGFASKALSPHLANVQCENCHGPRKQHIMNPSKKVVAPQTGQACRECHQGAHSPRFDYQMYWNKIKHGKS